MNIGFLHRDWQTNSAVKCKRWQSQNLNMFLTSCICFRHVFGNPGNVWEYTIPYSTCTCFTSNGDRETLIDTPILCSLSLQQFLGDLLKEAHKSQEVSEEQLIQYTDTMASDKTRTEHPFISATLSHQPHSISLAAPSLRFKQGRQTPAVRDGQVSILSRVKK